MRELATPATAGVNADQSAVAPTTPANQPTPDWQSFAGILKDSPIFCGDPLAIQKQLRGEWQ